MSFSKIRFEGLSNFGEKFSFFVIRFGENKVCP
jgi:hypothetical protein